MKEKINTIQIDIDFEQAAKNTLEEERDEIAKKYKVVDKTKIFKDPDGVWKFYGTYRPVKEWGEEIDELYKDNDNSSLYRH